MVAVVDSGQWTLSRPHSLIASGYSLDLDELVFSLDTPSLDTHSVPHYLPCLCLDPPENVMVMTLLLLIIIVVVVDTVWTK